MVEAMKVELQRALVEADEIDAREVEVEAERQREAKAIEERRAAYVAAARQAAPVEVPFPSLPSFPLTISSISHFILLSTDL